MKIDLNYLKKLLKTFENSEKAFINIIQLKINGFEYESEEFIFHLHLLWDNDIIATEDPEDTNFGLSRESSGQPVWMVKNLRLTYEGHQFLESLENSDIWSKLKKDFKDSTLSTIKNVAKSLMEEYLKQKLGLTKN